MPEDDCDLVIVERSLLEQLADRVGPASPVREAEAVLHQAWLIRMFGRDINHGLNF